MRVLILAGMAMAAPAMAQQGVRDRAAVLMSENAQERAFQTEYGYADAVVVDGTAYLSGVVVGPGPGGDLAAGYDQAFQKLGGILTRAGGNWRDVVDITSYHTDLPKQLKAMSDVKARYVTAPFPAWTAIQVVRLVPDGGVTEIKLVARIAPQVPPKPGARR